MARSRRNHPRPDAPRLPPGMAQDRRAGSPVVHASERALLVSKPEADLLARLVPAATDRIQGVSNGVDHRNFDPSGFAGAQPGDAPEFVFTGTMDYPPNADAVAWFANAILPLIRQAEPRACFTIVGANPSRGDARPGQPGRRHRHRPSRRCPSLSRPRHRRRRADAHRPGHPEQSAGSHGHGPPRRADQRRVGRDRTPRPARTCYWPTRNRTSPATASD